jgi:hypothetical protein
MPRGVHLSDEIKSIILYQRQILFMSAKEIFNVTFQSNYNKINKQYLQILVSSIDRMSEEDSVLFQMKASKKGGRRKLLNQFERAYLFNIFKDRRYRRLDKLAKDFAEEFFYLIIDAPSQRTVYNEFQRAEITRKVMERRHILQSPEQRLNYFQRIANVHPSMIIDIDETASSPDQFLEKYGWAPKSEKCMKTQIRIGNKHYSTIAAYTIHGFLVGKSLKVLLHL